VQAEMDSAKLNFEKALTTALNEVNPNYRAYKNAQASLANQEQRYQLDKKNIHYYQVRYQPGKNELKDWLEALNSEYS
ncbi:TolC family protein, partial [Neisseria sp. P0014.S006]